jgi:trk system potassium uptake protein TrkA
MSSLLAKAEGAAEVIAVSTSLRHMDLFRSLGIDHVISPHAITSQTIIANILRVPLGSLLRLKNVDVEVTSFVAGKDSLIVGRPLGELDTLFKKSIVIGSISRDNRVIIPSGETVIEENDEVHVLYQSANRGLVRRLFKPGRRFGL